MPQVIDTLFFGIAILPMATYLFALGLVNLSRRSVVVSGVRDTSALGMAVCGCVIAGPMRLFLPTATSFRSAAYVLPLLAAMYGMTLILIVLLQRPRIVIYNAAAEQVRYALANVVLELDHHARWAGDSLSLPTMGVQLHFESASLSRNVQLVSAGATQSLEGWARLELALRAAMSGHARPRNGFGLGLLAVAVTLCAVVVLFVVWDASAVARSVNELFHVAD